MSAHSTRRTRTRVYFARRQTDSEATSAQSEDRQVVDIDRPGGIVESFQRGVTASGGDPKCVTVALNRYPLRYPSGGSLPPDSL